MMNILLNIFCMLILYSLLTSHVGARKFSDKESLDQVEKLMKENFELNRTILDQMNTIKTMNVTLQTYIKVKILYLEK
jgi:hypothetical protein